VYVSKLQTSRIGNSEKYLVCKGFRFQRPDMFFPYIRASFVAMVNAKGRHIYRFLNLSIPRIFITKLEDCNSMFGQQQIENIYYTISIIDKHPKGDKSEQLIKQNMTKCINWCIENEVPYNSMTNGNIFLSSTTT
jgi:hypothetical protein